MAEWIRWWEYKSFLKLMCTAVGTVVLGLLCALFIPTPWCLIPIGVIVIVGSFLIRKFIPGMLDDLAEIFGIDNEEKETE